MIKNSKKTYLSQAGSRLAERLRESQKQINSQTQASISRNSQSGALKLDNPKKVVAFNPKAKTSNYFFAISGLKKTQIVHQNHSRETNDITD